MTAPTGDAKALGQRLRRAREERGLSQKEVAQALGLVRPAISHMESGDRHVRALEATALCRLYRISVSDLLAGL